MSERQLDSRPPFLNLSFVRAGAPKWYVSTSVLIPIRMRRPHMTGKALCRGPLMHTRRANPARIEGVPVVAAGTGPAVGLFRLPSAKRTADSRTGNLAVLFIRNLSFRVGIDHDRHRDDDYTPYPHAPVEWRGSSTCVNQSKPAAAIRDPPAKEKNRHSRAQCPPERQNEIGPKPKGCEYQPKHLSFHTPSLQAAAATRWPKKKRRHVAA